MGLQLHVQLYSGDQPIGASSFDADKVRTIKIGRLSSAQVKLDDPGAARIHAVIEISGNAASLIDMGSAAGTTVNGNKVHKVKLNHGDTVGIGNTRIVIGLGAPGVQQVMAAPMAAAGGGAPMAAPMAGAMPGAMPGGMPAAMPGVAPAAVPGMPAAVPGAMPGAMPGVVPGAMPAAMPAAAPAAQMPVPGMAPGMMPPGAQVAAPAAMPAAAPAQPVFDGGAQAAPSTARRASRDRVFQAAVESRPHPSLPPEPKMTDENRVLEMRAFWGEVLLGVYHYRQPKRITIGEAKGTDFFITSEGLPVEVFPLVRYQDGEYQLTFTKHMEGEIEINGELQAFETIRGSSVAKKDPDLEESYQIKMAMNDRALVHWGGATFALRFVPPAKPPERGFFKGMDLQYVNLLVISFLFHVAALATMLWYPYDTDSLRVDLFDEDAGRFADIVLHGPTETKNTEDLLERLKKQVEDKKEQLEKQPTKELKPDPNQKVKPIKRQVTQAERTAEVKQRFSKMFSSGSGSGGGSLLGGGGGGTLSGSLSNVIGTTGTGSATAGLQGLGIRGSGPMTGGGIGTSRGIAGIGTSGRGGGGGLAYGSGIGIGKKVDRGMISLSTPVVMGALPKEAIQRVIDQNKAQIRYCYEVQLQRDQNLEGRVVMTWIIAATGSVAKVKVRESSLKNPAVERCIAAKIKDWKFPAPSGGGIVEVNYPFVLRAG